MQLSVLERIVLVDLLPTEGNFANLKLLRVAKEALSFTDEENARLQFQPAANGKIQWKTNFDTEIEIGEVVTILIQDILKKLDAEKKLKEEHVSLFEKFVDGG